MKTITRRTALAVPVTLPLLPVSAFATPADTAVEAYQRPTMRFVPIKTREQQSVLMLHRTRQLFVRQRTALINAIRAHLAEFGIVAGVGRNGVEALLALIAKGGHPLVIAAMSHYGT